MLLPKAQTYREGSGDVRLSILRRGHLLAAPDAVFLRAHVNDRSIREAVRPTDYDESHHRLRYLWDFGDAGAASGKVVNVPAAHNDLNTAYGKEVAHVFRQAGRFRVTCTVHGPEGLIGTGELIVAVDDPERAFGGTRTILLDPDGVGDSAYPNAQVARDWDSAFAAAAQGPGTGSRVLLRRGRSYTRQSEQRLNRRNGSIHVGAFGDGAPPVVFGLAGAAVFQVTPNFDGAAVIQGLDLRGPWDAATETGAVGDRRVHGIQAAQGHGRSLLIDDCSLDGFGTGLFVLGERTPDEGLFVLHDCDITNWGDYGVYTGTNMASYVAILGTAIHQHPEAMQGGMAKDGFSHNEHGPVRITGSGHFHMDVCDLFSRTGWTRLDGVPADQPCFRWNTSANPGSAGMVSRTAMEGGYAIALLRDQNNSGERYLSNFVMEKCLLVGSASTIIGVQFHFTGQTLRNNIFVMPDLPSASVGWQSMVDGAERVNPEGQRDADAPVEVYSNTLIQRRSPANRGGPMNMDRGMDEFAVYSLENNLFHTPGGAGMGGEAGLELTGGPIETVGGTWQPRFLGLKYQTERPEMDRSLATPAETVRDLVPRPGTPGADDAMGSDALDDFYGRLRGEAPDRGAIET